MYLEILGIKTEDSILILGLTNMSLDRNGQ